MGTNFRFRRTVWDWKFASCTSNLWKQTCDCRRYTGFLSESRFRVFKISGKISLVTVLSIVIHVVYIGNQTSRAFVPYSGPIGDCSCQFVYGPKTVQSTSACQLMTSEDNLRAYFWQFSSKSQSSSSLNWWSSWMELRLCIVAELCYWPARNIVPHVSLHDFPYHRAMYRCSHQVSPS